MTKVVNDFLQKLFSLNINVLDSRHKLYLHENDCIKDEKGIIAVLEAQFLPNLRLNKCLLYTHCGGS